MFLVAQHAYISFLSNGFGMPFFKADHGWNTKSPHDRISAEKGFGESETKTKKGLSIYSKMQDMYRCWLQVSMQPYRARTISYIAKSYEIRYR